MKNKSELKKLFSSRIIVREDDENELRFSLRGRNVIVNQEQEDLWDVWTTGCKSNRRVTVIRDALQVAHPGLVFHELEGEGWCKVPLAALLACRKVLGLSAPRQISDAHRAKLAELSEARRCKLK